MHSHDKESSNAVLKGNKSFIQVFIEEKMEENLKTMHRLIINKFVFVVMMILLTMSFSVEENLKTIHNLIFNLSVLL